MKELAPSSPLEHSAEQNPRVAEAVQLLEQGVDQIITSDGFQRYLKTIAKFHTYSANNVMLIMMQRPEATKVAGFRKWQELGRQVQKGESALKIFAPILVKDPQEKDEQGKPREHLIGYRLANVFDIAQTQGKPLPEPPAVKLLEGESSLTPRLYNSVSAFLHEQGVTVKREPLPREGYNGYFRPSTKTIGINYRLGGDAALKTLCHEASHFLADHRGTIPKEDAESVAEGSAFVVMQHFGLDSGEYSFSYIAQWAEDKAVLLRNLAEIQKISHTLIEGTNKHLAEVVLFDRSPKRDELLPNRGLNGTAPQF